VLSEQYRELMARRARQELERQQTWVGAGA
jgi:hypothetical protein